MKSMMRMMSLCGVLALIGCDPIGSRVDALDEIAWEGSEWIAVSPASAHKAGANWFTCTVKNKRAVVGIRWMTAASGTYELYANGKKVGKEAFKGMHTNEKDSYVTLTYDLTQSLKLEPEQVNNFTAEVFADEGAFRGVVEILYRDGREDFVGTDTVNWRAGIGGTTRCGADGAHEVQDGRLEDPVKGVENAARAVASGKFFGEIAPAVGPLPIPYPEGLTEPMEAGVLTFNAGEIREIDFGREVQGVPCLEVTAPAGTVITVDPGFTYICRGGGERVMARSAFHTYRKLKISSSQHAKIKVATLPLAFVDSTVRMHTFEPEEW